MSGYLLLLILVLCSVPKVFAEFCGWKICPSNSTCSTVGNNSECTCITGLCNQLSVESMTAYLTNLKMDATFTEAYHDSESAEFKQLSKKVEEGMTTILTNNYPNTIDVHVVTITKGSVIALIRILVDNRVVEIPVQANGIEAVIKGAITDGNLSKYLNDIAADQDIVVEVDGDWSKWEINVACSVTCGGGIMYRNRSCNNPFPANGGVDCLMVNGISRTKYENASTTCNTNGCPDSPCAKVLAEADKSLLDAFLPKCKADGSYEDKQCYGFTGYCWCVESMTGKEILGTRKGPGKGQVSCDGKKERNVGVPAMLVVLGIILLIITLIGFCYYKYKRNQRIPTTVTIATHNLPPTEGVIANQQPHMMNMNNAIKNNPQGMKPVSTIHQNVCIGSNATPPVYAPPTYAYPTYNPGDGMEPEKVLDNRGYMHGQGYLPPPSYYDAINN